MMEMEGGLSFGAPQWFWAFAVFPVLFALWWWNERRARVLLEKLVASRLLGKLAGSVSWAKRRSRFALFLLGMALALVALAQPRFGYTWEEAKQRGRDVLVAVDVSKSMLATDIAPNRLERAKLAIQDLIVGLKGDRIGLIAFAGTAFLQAPLTIDEVAVRNALNELDTDIIPQGGSNIADAIRAAREAFGKGESEHRALIILTDGEELDANALSAAEEVREEMRIFTVGIGTEEGSLIPLPGKRGEFVKDADGNFVKSRLDEDRLRRIAESASGWYIRLVQGRPEMLRLIRDGIASMGTKENDTRMSRRPIERYHWPLSASLLMLVASMLLGERRQVASHKRGASARAAATAGLVLLVLCGLESSQAAPLNPGVAAYEREDYASAVEQFSRQAEQQPESAALQFNLGSAAYKSRDYETAVEAFSKAATSTDPQLRAKAAYNLGNTLFQRGAGVEKKEAKLAEWRNALAQYDGSLAINPGDENAQYNREVVRKLIEALEKEEKQEQQEQQQDQKQEDQQQQQDQQDQQQQGDSKDQQQQGGDQQKKSEQGSEQQPQQGGEQSEQQGQQGNDQQQPQDGKGTQPDDANKGEEGKESDQQKQPDGGKSQPGQRRPDQKQGKEPGQLPVQPEGQKPSEGQLQAAQPGQTGENREDQGADAAAAAAEIAAAQNGMTPEEARALLESLRTEDQRVRLIQPDARKLPRRNIRDW